MKGMVVISILLMAASVSSLACTAFCLCSGQQVLLAKNLDWPVDDGLILVNRAGISKLAFRPCGKTLAWTSLYRSITFNQFGKEFPLGGMNEKGLVVEELNMPPAGTVEEDSAFSLNEFQLVQYLLDVCSNLEDIPQVLERVRVSPELLSLHYLVMDRSGRSLVLEPFRKGIRIVQTTDTGISVLGNNLYQESIQYLKKFEGFGGDVPVVHRSGSNERFVSVSSMLSGPEEDDPVHSAFAILDTVSQPDTRWSIVYDATNLEIYFKFHDCESTRVIKLDKVLLDDKGATRGVEVGFCRDQFWQIFGPLTEQEHLQLLNDVLEQLEEELDLSGKQELFEEWFRFSSSYLIP